MTLIDAHLPVYQFRELHQLLLNAAPGDLLDAVNTPGIVDDPWVQWFIRLREAPSRILGSLGYPSQLKDKRAFGLDDFTRLGRVSDREIGGSVLEIRLRPGRYLGYSGVREVQRYGGTQARAQFLG